MTVLGARTSAKRPGVDARLLALSAAVQRLSMAPDLEEIQRVVRTTARRLTGADGATFVLRDGDQCFYTDEDAITPLWKGRRFPLDACVSGWSMLNRSATVIPDIYADDRVPHAAYRPTFVKSMMMVPIRRLDPIGTIGVYWAEHHEATEEELQAAQALADSTSVALTALEARTQLSAAVQLSETDPLTGLPNRRVWDAALAGAQTDGRKVCIAVLDFDHFKAYNDVYGHDGGDRLLVAGAAAWKAALRPGDVLARLGGEEFGLLLADCGRDAALEVAERLRAATPDGATISLGLAAWDGAESMADLQRRADAAVYVAKRAGRDRCVTA